MKHWRDSTSGIGIRPLRGRRGAVALVALVGLLVAGMISTTLVQLAVTRHRQIEQESLRLQAEWLVEAGLERAAARLAGDPDYDGETWIITAENFGRERSARVTITVAPEPEVAGRYRLTAVADYPDKSERRARARQSVALDRAG